MELFEKGKLYFIKDSFFDLVKDEFLKINKEQTDRPHYYTFQDSNTGLLWMVPCSSQIEKYERIIKSKEEKHRPSNHIQIINVSGKKQVFLFQDMFPILPEYIKGVYKNSYGDFKIADPKLIDRIESNARKIIKLLRHGVKFTPTQPDIMRIEQIMLGKLNQREQESRASQISVNNGSLQNRLNEAINRTVVNDDPAHNDLSKER